MIKLPEKSIGPRPYAKRVRHAGLLFAILGVKRMVHMFRHLGTIMRVKHLSGGVHSFVHVLTPEMVDRRHACTCAARCE